MKKATVDITCGNFNCDEIIAKKGDQFPIGSTKVRCKFNHETLIIVE